LRILPGQPYPLGASWDGSGVNFAIYSENAEAVELCLFDSPESRAEKVRIRLEEYTDMVWHCYLPDVRPGTLYGYRIYGPYDPARGHRFNPAKITLDPYAKAIGRDLIWNDSVFSFTQRNEKDETDSAPYAPLARVIDTAFTWGDDRRPNVPWDETIIYETHVKGFSARHPEIPENQRGTYTAFSSDPVIRYLKELGITSVEFLPIHHHISEHFLLPKKLSNYWGYNTLGYFAPHTGYAAPGTDAVQEFKVMVRSLHNAGIEVILDVVYNHTAEGDHLGPTLSLRGIDNVSYYRLDAKNPALYVDYTGCGNTLNMMNPRVLQLIMDSLRYWTTEMHVDGFRFDLASTLARELHSVDKLGAFFDIIHQDPVLSRVKLIAEPWDLGEGGYQVGNFPVLWTEWNGKYRDSVRKFWKGEKHQVAEIATRLSGSSDLYEKSGRRPYASINFVTCHDGFTMNDLVSYSHKHNEENQESNRDGSDSNLSWNCGVEGPSDDPEILAFRARQRRNIMATMLLSQGVPMILGGDEIIRSQNGNNNAYCQDNDISYYHWDLKGEGRKFLDFVRSLIRLRRENGVLRRRNFFQGRPIRGTGVKDIFWLNADGMEMTDDQWNAVNGNFIAILLPEGAIQEKDYQGNRVRGETLLVLLNGSDNHMKFKIPPVRENHCWWRIIDTAVSSGHEEQQIIEKNEYLTEPWSVVVFAEKAERRQGQHILHIHRNLR